MKITIYTISDCQFSKQEKEYLSSHGLTYEEKNLEANKDFLTEMLAISNNFAGTPVTKIEKDDGQITVLKGFTKEEFDQALGLVQQAAPVAAPVAPPIQPVVAEPAPAVQAAESTMTMPSDTPPVQPPTPPVVPEPTVTPTPQQPTQEIPAEPVIPPVQSAPDPEPPEPEQPPTSPEPMPEPPSAPIPPVESSLPDNQDQNKLQADINEAAEAALTMGVPQTPAEPTPVAPVETTPVANPAVSPAPAAPAQDPQLNNILQNLQSKVEDKPPAPTPFPAQNQNAGMPQIPEPDFH